MSLVLFLTWKSLLRPIVTGEMTQNIVENPAMQDQVIVHDIPEVAELIQERILDPIEVLPHERVQQFIAEQIVHMPVPQTQEPPVFVTAPKLLSWRRTSSLLMWSSVSLRGPIEQIVDDPIPPLVHVLKTLKEGIERNEKQIAALTERIPSRDRRRLQKEMEQQHQILQSTKGKLAAIMREMHAT